MPNWRSISLADLYAIKSAGIVDTARTVSLANGQADPSIEAISGAVSRVRAAISVGNTLDVDPTKVPNSLVVLTSRIAVRILKGRAEMDVTKQDELDEVADRTYLARIADKEHPIQFETADNPSGSAEMNAGQPFQVATSTRRHFTERALHRLS